MPIQAFETVFLAAGEVEVVGNTYIRNGVSVHIDGDAGLDVRLPMTSDQARALAAQLIAAADYAEGKA